MTWQFVARRNDGRDLRLIGAHKDFAVTRRGRHTAPALATTHSAHADAASDTDKDETLDPPIMVGSGERGCAAQTSG